MSFLGGLAGGAVGGAVVNLYLDDKQFKSGLVQAEAQTKAATNTASTSASKFGQVATVAFAAAAVGAVKFGVAAIAAAREHEQAVTQLELAVEGSTAALQSQASALQMVTGFSDEAILGADTILSRYNLTTQQLQELNPLILDFARAQGVDATEAAGTFGKALLGNARAIKAIGGEFEATGDTTTDLATLMGILEEKVGGVAEAFGQTSQGQAEIFQQKFDELQETVGKYLLPVLDALVQTLTWMLDNLALITSLVVGFGVAWTAVNFAQVAVAVKNLAAAAASTVVALGPMAALAAILGIALYGLSLRAAQAAENLDKIPAAAKEIVDQLRTDDMLQYAATFALLREEAERYGNTEDFLIGVQAEARQAFVDGAISVEQYRSVLANSGKTLPQINRMIADVSGGVNNLRVHFDEAGHKIANFNHMVGDELEEFRESTKESFAGAGTSVFGFKAKFEGTVRSFQRGLANMRQRAEETLQDLREFNTVRIGDSIRAFLLEQGPDAIHAFVEANKDGRRSIVDDINGILEAQRKQGPQIDEATEKTNGLTSAMGRLGQKNVTATAAIKYVLAEGSLDPGQLPGLSGGGG